MVRELAGYQVERYAAVMRWPVGEALAAYEARLKRDAERAYQLDLVLWAIGAQAGSKARRPERPEILKD